MDVKKGEDVALPCEAKGDPTPEVEWSKDDELLTEQQDTTIISNSKRTAQRSGNLCLQSNKPSWIRVLQPSRES